MKKCLLFLLCLVLLSGCTITRMDNKTYEEVIDSILSLNNGGRLAIITFHSLEDKIVKHAYEEMEGRCTCPKDFPVCVCNYKSYGKIVNKKPIISTEEELIQNPRARSAKLRVFERIEK